MKKMISRRNFLKVCAVAGSAVALSACGGSKKAATVIHGAKKLRLKPFATERRLAQDLAALRPALTSWAVSLL